WRRLVPIAAVGALALTGMLPAVAAPNEYAPSIGTLTGPTSVSTNVPFSVVGSGNCPAGTRLINGFIHNPTGTPTPRTQGQVLAISANSTDIASLTTTGVPLSDNLANLASNAGKTVSDGTYQFSLVCQPDPFSAATAQLDGTFTVTGTQITWAVPGVTQTTTTMVASPAGSARVGDTVTLTATVTPAATAGNVQVIDTVS